MRHYLKRKVPHKIRLTKTAVRTLQPRNVTYQKWDTVQRGFCVRVEPTGYKAYKVVYRHFNRPRWYHIGATDAISLPDARRLAAEVMLEVARGNDPAAKRQTIRAMNSDQTMLYKAAYDALREMGILTDEDIREYKNDLHRRNSIR